MSLSRVTASSFGCHACWSAVAYSLLSANGAVPPRASWTAPVASPAKPPQRPFTSGLRRQDERDTATASPSAAEDPPHAFINTGPTPLASAGPSTPAESSSVAPSTAAIAPTTPIPWYLQNRPTPTPQQPALIPALPHHPPPLLEPLLEYLSVTAGLDDLTLLDLRHLDPPPALGPKLIMLIGTARSEKHLHVAADRFCRYLRRTYSLRPNPDGLLGRNELKIKLRRKAKRMKMLANVGGAEQEGNMDDGIRTGWICCTVGKLEAHPEDTEMPGDNVEEFVGFRDIKPGVNVVVQMFTEEKRDEIDLETLWGGVLRTHDRQGKKAEEELKQLYEEDVVENDHVEIIETKETEEEAERQTESEARPIPEPVVSDSPTPKSRPLSPLQQFVQPKPSAGDFFPPASNSSSVQQIRRIHSIGLRG
ncbi:hypothetical protein BDV95DRAFT_572037 [Massariosphaeria phaeospora]|uniref:ATPase synthesis protein 25 n=1 Tax=Massariosphaeria phaeospora TaxID=100035 RepID=A0A7C8I5M9_9PLEO|nr:hypothetical protein BDV95DRAFT_572037 [Massariosphaeria phaeospora]